MKTRQINKLAIIMSFFILVLFSASAALATDYYVSPSGSDLGTGTIDSPWQHIAYALCGGSYHCPIKTTNPNTPVAGDTLYLRGGTYYENNIYINNSGTAGSPITIKNYPGETPVIDGGFTNSPYLTGSNSIQFAFFIVSSGSGYTSMATNVPVTGGSGTGMTVNIGYTSDGGLHFPSIDNPGSGYKIGDIVAVAGGTGTLKLHSNTNVQIGVINADGAGLSYLTFDGLNIEHGWRGNIIVGNAYAGHDITIQNCDLHDVIATDNAGEIFLNHGTSNILIQNNKLHGIILAPDSSDMSGDGVWVSNNVNTAIIQNNEMYNLLQAVWLKYQQPALSAPPFIIRDNFIHDLMSSPRYNAQPEGTAAININNWGTQVTNNLIYNSPSVGINIGESFSCSAHSNGGAFVSHNTIVNAAVGIIVDWASGCAANPPDDNTFRDNIIYNFTSAQQRGVAVWEWDNAYTADQSVTDFDHNLLYSASYSSPILTNCNGGYCYNSLAACPFSVCRNNIGQAPVFRDPGNGDFTLKPNSPGWHAASDGTSMGANVQAVGLTSSAGPSATTGLQ